MNEQINVNATASVILTKFGAEDLNNYNRQFHLGPNSKENEKWFPTTYKEGDEYKTELHCIMHIFGPNLFPGMDARFKNNEITLIKY